MVTVVLFVVTVVLSVVTVVLSVVNVVLSADSWDPSLSIFVVCGLWLELCVSENLWALGGVGCVSEGLWALGGYGCVH